MELKKGDLVKVRFSFSHDNKDDLGAERIWVKVLCPTHIPSDGWIGKLDNYPVLLDKKIGDLVFFKTDQVVDLYCETVENSCK
jgi:hypothetical protein